MFQGSSFSFEIEKFNLGSKRRNISIAKAVKRNIINSLYLLKIKTFLNEWYIVMDIINTRIHIKCEGKLYSKFKIKTTLDSGMR